LPVASNDCDLADVEMTARIIDGAELSRSMREEISREVSALADDGIVPGLTVVLVGADPASEVYVGSKTRACEAAGMRGRTVRLPSEVSQDELFAVIDALNADAEVDGILVQLPLPPHLPYKAVLGRIDPRKDVDGFHPLNAGLSFVGDEKGFVPATPAGIIEILRREEISTRGRHVVIVGRSLIVSKPLASLLMAPGPDATVTLTHKHTVGLATHTRSADILVVAVGKPGLITADMVKPGATVIDVGVSRVEDPGVPKGYRISGDVDFDEVRKVAGAITPVPGGVGPMTITMLLSNTLKGARGRQRRGVAGDRSGES
jgi:methylenetetrahydrofolate dehydrogenase (NADP+)/methenyltetrahydrofolate cyclohydrolase